MRIFSYILAVLVTIFVINIALSFSLPSYRNVLVSIRSELFPYGKDMQDKKKTEERMSESSRLIESLEKIDKHIESLSETKKQEKEKTISGTTSLQEELSGKEQDIPLSGLFLAKIMPEVTLKKLENSGFFGIRVMENIRFSTYIDEGKGLKVYAFVDTYDTILLNMKLTNSVYSLNETDQFFGFTFFLNTLKKDPKDTVIRFVTALEGRAIGVEVSKNYYDTLKKMLLKNK